MNLCWSPSQIRPLFITLERSATLYAAGEDEKNDVAQSSNCYRCYVWGQTIGTPEKNKDRIEKLIENNQVIRFMESSKAFPHCGFSDTATKILERLTVDFAVVDVLSDESIRQGIKEFSQWPTIPQLYVNKEFIGSDHSTPIC